MLADSCKITIYLVDLKMSSSEVKLDYENVNPCRLVEKYGRFRGTCYLHRQRD